MTEPLEIHEPTLDAVKALFNTERGVGCRTYYDGWYIADQIETLRPAPPKSEAELLVDEWVAQNVAYESQRAVNVALAQFVLDRERATHAATPPPITPEAPEAPEAQSPVYVYGPWIEWHGGDECPVSGDWFVQVHFDGDWVDYDAAGNKFIDFSEANDEADGRPASKWHWYHDGIADITHYRVRFEVGKWYDWAGGSCPVPGDTRVVVGFSDRDKVDGYYAKAWSWKHIGSKSSDITQFCIEGATQ